MSARTDKNEDNLYWEKLEREQYEKRNVIYKEFPIGTRVELKTGRKRRKRKRGKRKLGTVVEKPVEEIICYAPWYVPIKWDGQPDILPVSKFKLKIISNRRE